ncbi:MAG: segregation/condensation protein A [Tissierellia bacterium]|nr:segregation/condensation protein A [Tissierellia bacterium]
MINVKTNEFYGPFDLLLELIEKSKIDIYDIQISTITNEYIDVINNLDIPIDEIADFILIATQLLYIKTNSLIKDTFYEETDFENDNITQEELIRRLLEYKKIKSVIFELKELEINGLKKHYKLQEDLTIYSKDEIEISFDLSKLTNVLENLINKNLNKQKFQVDRILNIEEYSLEEYNDSIKLEIIEKKMMSITKMLSRIESKSEAIIIFLSILELSKRRDLNIFQDVNTMEIIVKARENYG